MSDELSGIIDRLQGIHATKAAEMAIAEIESWRRWQDRQPKLFEGFPEGFFSEEDVIPKSDWYNELKKVLEKGVGKPVSEWHKIEPQEYDVFFGFDKGDDMSEQLPEYETGKPTEYLVHWHNGDERTYSYVLADHILVSPETGVLYLHLARETVFFSQTWTSVFKSTNKPK